MYQKSILRIMQIMVMFMIFSHTAEAQENNTAADSVRSFAVKVFLDCRTCDMNYTREEIPYINYVRDVTESQIYINVTTQNAGSGGNQYTYTFAGQKEFAGLTDTLVYTSSPDQTSTEIRKKRTDLLKMGLMRYVARTPLFNEIEIGHNAELKSEEVIDNWRNWVFEIQVNPRYNSEESYKRLNLSNSFTVSKITSDIKLEIDFDQSYNRQRFIQGSYDTTYLRNSESVDLLFVKSLGEHWSAGLLWDIETSSAANYDLNFDFMPAIEYDLFPYSEATHKQLRVLYSIGYQHSNYSDTTIFNLMSENLFRHELRVAYQVQEKWGSVNISLNGSNYFHDWSKNRIELDGFIRIRLFKGLSLSVDAGVAYINNSLNLAKGDLTEAERLLRLKQQATKYQVGGGVGINYTFGSIYNNVVNPRFGRY